MDATAELSLLPRTSRGLRGRLQLPSPSLVFRDIEVEDEILGYTGVISDDGAPVLDAGVQVTCSITFIGVPAASLWPGRRFALWMGRDVGEAKLLTVSVR